MMESLQRLFRKGVRYGTIIDVGCADGIFCVNLADQGFAAGAVPLNIDANRLYEPSLQDIASVLGGHYRIAAATDFIGEIELTMSAHPYWASLRPQDDPYWQRVNGLSAEKVKVPATTLDRLVEELSLQPPYLLKLDVQGAETSVLRGASQTLRKTHVIVCEADVSDFQTINACVVEAQFHLYDLEGLSRVPDGTLGWFYPIYVHRDLESVRPGAFWDAADNQRVMNVQVKRRRAQLEFSARVLGQLRRKKALEAGPAALEDGANTGRNAPCPCGSGKRYKHCCGAHA